MKRLKSCIRTFSPLVFGRELSDPGVLTELATEVAQERFSDEANLFGISGVAAQSSIGIVVLYLSNDCSECLL